MKHLLGALAVVAVLACISLIFIFLGGVQMG